MMNVLEWPERGNALSSKTVHAPALSSLDTLHGDVLAYAALPNAKRFTPGLATATFPAAAARAGSIELTDVIPKA